MELLSRQGRRLLVGVVGGTMMLVGLVVLPLPIPLGLILLASGLALLSTEFVFARRWVHALHHRTGKFGRGLQVAERKAMAVLRRLFGRSASGGQTG
ncbi:MAG: PGPGW domain-containing protein [Planctomycetota bacterium]